MGGRQDLAHRQAGDVALGMVEELQGRGAGPGALQGHVLAIVADQLADARRAIDVGDDFYHEGRLGEAGQDRRMVDLAVLVSHGRGDAEHRAVVERAEQRLVLMDNLGSRELLGKTPDLAAAGDRRIVVEIHGVDVAAFLYHAVLARETDRDYLAGFGVVAEAGRVGHADEFVAHRVAERLERLGNDGPQKVGVGAVADDDEFAVVEFVGRPRIRRVVERHREGVLADIGNLHFLVSCSRPCRARSKVNTPSALCGRCRTSGWRSVLTMSS